MLYQGRYDVALCLNPNVPFTIASIWALIPVRIGIIPNFCGMTLRIALTFNSYLIRHRSGMLVAETYLKMLKVLDIDTADVSKEVYSHPDADSIVTRFLSERAAENSKPLIGIAVGSGNRLKALSPRIIAKVADLLVEEFGGKVILIGTVIDRDTASQILSMSNKRDFIIDSTGVFDLTYIPALIKKLSLLIGVDTGTVYIADALSIPLIDIAGPSNILDQRPLGRNCRIIQKALHCVPCSHAFRAPYSCSTGNRGCIESVSAEEIFEVARTLMREAGP